MGTPALELQPPDVADAPANLTFTTVTGLPAGVNFGANLPAPLILQDTEPVALSGTAPLTPSPTTVTVVIARTKTALTPTNFRIIVSPPIGRRRRQQMSRRTRLQGGRQPAPTRTNFALGAW